ncbi:MAG: LysE family translocator [Acidilobaceae archaeon]|nr:LysE family translocator [Acidilobaceae archaeon]MCX8165061.1 LysE family translocator [Acidilobaceae archaeon]MDW7974422.1 LysE family transporter [Sulfolobales archaeon]
MSYGRLLLLVLAITPSGALSPGPLSASAVAVGAALGALGGLMVAVGHMMVELPYILLIHRFMQNFKELLERARRILNVLIFFLLLYFSYLLISDSVAILRGEDVSSAGITANSYLEAILVGALFTGFNAHFLAWWLTIGYPLLESASKLGARGIGVMYVSHVSIDYLWLTLLAAGGGASKLIGDFAYALLLIALALVLLFFAFNVAREIVRNIRP